MVSATVSGLLSPAAVPFLLVEAYNTIVERVQACGIGAPRAKSSPLKGVVLGFAKKVLGPVHHLTTVPGVTPVTRKLAPFPAGPAGPVVPVVPVAPAAPVAPIGPIGPI